MGEKDVASKVGRVLNNDDTEVNELMHEKGEHFVIMVEV
jgi:hypothetical protein